MKNDKFRRDITRHIAKSKNALSDYAKAVVIEVDKRLVQKSPVDTGRFKANWVIGNGSVNTLTKESFTQSNNKLEISSIKVNGQTIYITNSLPYAYRLEMGWSKQAPLGMTRVTLAELNTILNGAAYEVKGKYV